MRCISNDPKISIHQPCSFKSILMSEVVLDNRLCQNNHRFLCCFFQESSRWSPISTRFEDFGHRLSVECPHDTTRAKPSGSCWTIAARFDNYCDIIILGLTSIGFMQQLARRAVCFTRRGSELNGICRTISCSALDCLMSFKSDSGFSQHLYEMMTVRWVIRR